MPDPRIQGIPEPADVGSGNGPNGNDTAEAPAGESPSGAEPASRPAPAGDQPAAPDPRDRLIPDPDAPAGGSGTPQAAVGPREDEGEAVDVDALAAKAAKAEEYLELAQRTRAEFENYRKRATREAAAAQERGALKLAKELLPALDNLDRALAHAASSEDGNGDDSLITGIKHVHADLIAALRRAEIEPYSPEGEAFDPQYHEAVAQQPFEGTAPGTVVEVYQRGYRRGENVLRPARVIVAG